MKTAMDRSGRVVIPSAIRHEAALKPGAPLEIRCVDGSVIIEPQAAEARLERRGHVTVVLIEPEPPGLPHRDVEEVRQQLRRERDEDSLGHAPKRK
jgi:AbrB family looped-hinge helix DNA binding protein